MAKNKKEKIDEPKVERLNNKNIEEKRNLSDGFYYLLAIVIGVILIFATEEFLSTINYLFVVIFAVVAVIKIISFFMDKQYEKKTYGDLITGVMSAWIAMFVFKYGQFFFLEILPGLVSLLLFTMGISSLTKYYDGMKNGNLVIGIISFILGILLIFLPGSIMYIFFKITGVYLLITVILDLIDYRQKTRKD